MGNAPPKLEHTTRHEDAFVTLVRAERTWRFACAPGDEAALLVELNRIAADPAQPFDRFDAAIVAYHVAKNIPASRPESLDSNRSSFLP